MNKALYIIILSLLLIAPALSLESLGPGGQNEDFTIVQTCSDATQINITSIQFPNRTIDPTTIEMSSSGNGGYYYIFNRTADVGRYDVCGISDGCERNFCLYFEITPEGENIGETNILLSGILFGLLTTTVVFTVLAYKQRDNFYKLFFSFLALLAFFFFLSISNSMIRSFTMSESLITLFDYMYWVYLTITGIVLLVLIITFLAKVFGPK